MTPYLTIPRVDTKAVEPQDMSWTENWKYKCIEEVLVHQVVLLTRVATTPKVRALSLSYLGISGSVGSDALATICGVVLARLFGA